MGGRRGFYGCEMGYKRFSDASEVKFARVRLIFCTRPNYKSHACEFLFHGKADPISPRHQPKKIQEPDQFHPIIKLKRSSPCKKLEKRNNKRVLEYVVEEKKHLRTGERTKVPRKKMKIFVAGGESRAGIWYNMRRKRGKNNKIPIRERYQYEKTNYHAIIRSRRRSCIR